MSGRSWLVVIVIAAAVLGGFWYVMSPDSGDVEFERAQQALKSVKSWSFTETPQPDLYRKGGSWDVDCDNLTPPSPSTFGGGFSEEPDFSATCSALPRGGTGHPFPDFGVLRSQAVISSKGTKEVNGVKCREWFVQVVKFGKRQNINICLGTKDHLPYEILGEYEPHLTFSNYVLAEK